MVVRIHLTKEMFLGMAEVRWLFLRLEVGSSTENHSAKLEVTREASFVEGVRRGRC